MRERERERERARRSGRLTLTFFPFLPQHGEALNWYYHSGEKVYGPYPASAMSSWYRQKKLKPNLLVRKGADGMFVMLKHLTRGQHEEYDPFGTIPKNVRAEIMKRAYSSIIGVVAAMRVTQ